MCFLPSFEDFAHTGAQTEHLRYSDSSPNRLSQHLDRDSYEWTRRAELCFLTGPPDIQTGFLYASLLLQTLQLSSFVCVYFHPAAAFLMLPVPTSGRWL